MADCLVLLDNIVGCAMRQLALHVVHLSVGLVSDPLDLRLLALTPDLVQVRQEHVYKGHTQVVPVLLSELVCHFKGIIRYPGVVRLELGRVFCAVKGSGITSVLVLLY